MPASIPSMTIHPQPRVSFVSAASGAVNQATSSEAGGKPKQSSFSNISDFVCSNYDSLRQSNEMFTSTYGDLTKYDLSINIADRISPEAIGRNSSLLTQDIIKNMEIDTLFYIFYFMPNTIYQ